MVNQGLCDTTAGVNNSAFTGARTFQITDSNNDGKAESITFCDRDSSAGEAFHGWLTLAFTTTPSGTKGLDYFVDSNGRAYQFKDKAANGNHFQADFLQGNWGDEATGSYTGYGATPVGTPEARFLDELNMVADSVAKGTLENDIKSNPRIRHCLDAMQHYSAGLDGFNVQ